MNKQKLTKKNISTIVSFVVLLSELLTANVIGLIALNPNGNAEFTTVLIINCIETDNDATFEGQSIKTSTNEAVSMAITLQFEKILKNKVSLLLVIISTVSHELQLIPMPSIVILLSLFNLDVNRRIICRET